MIDPAYNQLKKHPHWISLLVAYEHATTIAREAEGFDGWIPRINEFEGIDQSELCRVHGKLISLGYLKFNLGGRLEGIKYQLSSDATRALSKGETPVAEHLEN